MSARDFKWARLWFRFLEVTGQFLFVFGVAVFMCVLIWGAAISGWGP